MHGGLTFSEIQTFQNSSACLLGTDPASSRLTCFVCLLGHCLSLLSLTTSSTCVLLVPGGLQLRGIFPRQWCVWESLFMFEWSFSLAGFGTSCFSSPCSPDCLSSFAHPDQVCCGPACELFDCQRHLNQIMCLSVLLRGWYYTHHSIRKNTCECIWGQVKKNLPQNSAVTQNDVKSTSKHRINDFKFKICMDRRLCCDNKTHMAFTFI